MVPWDGSFLVLAAAVLSFALLLHFGQTSDEVFPCALALVMADDWNFYPQRDTLSTTVDPSSKVASWKAWDSPSRWLPGRTQAIPLPGSHRRAGTAGREDSRNHVAGDQSVLEGSKGVRGSGEVLVLPSSSVLLSRRHGRRMTLRERLVVDGTPVTTIRHGPRAEIVAAGCHRKHLERESCIRSMMFAALLPFRYS